MSQLFAKLILVALIMSLIPWSVMAGGSDGGYDGGHGGHGGSDCGKDGKKQGDVCDRPEFCNGICCPQGDVPVCLISGLVCACVSKLSPYNFERLVIILDVRLAPLLGLGK